MKKYLGLMILTLLVTTVVADAGEDNTPACGTYAKTDRNGDDLCFGEDGSQVLCPAYCPDAEASVESSAPSESAF